MGSYYSRNRERMRLYYRIRESLLCKGKPKNMINIVLPFIWKQANEAKQVTNADEPQIRKDVDEGIRQLEFVERLIWLRCWHILNSCDGITTTLTADRVASAVAYLDKDVLDALGVPYKAPLEFVEWLPSYNDLTALFKYSCTKRTVTKSGEIIMKPVIVPRKHWTSGKKRKDYAMPPYSEYCQRFLQGEITWTDVGVKFGRHLLAMIAQANGIGKSERERARLNRTMLLRDAKRTD